MLRAGALVGVLAMATMVMADPPATAPTTDLDKLQGYWKPLQCELEGKGQMPADLMKQFTVVFDKSEYHLYFRDSKLDANGKPVILRLALANIAVDETTSPKTIHFEFADGPLKGKKCHGIYELAGNQLKMCYGSSDKPKPAKFESSAGSGCFLETWVRQEKK
jgi:uncharacterized protein (TIGR03067 family)